MVNQKMASEAPQSSEYSLVYSYLAVGIILLAVAFVVIPRVAVS